MGVALVHTGAVASLSLLRVFRSRGALFFSPVSKKSGSWEHLSLAFFFGPHCMVCGILVPQPWIEPRPPALEVLCPKHWTTRLASPSLAVLSVWPSLHTLTLLSDCVCSRCLSPPKKPGLVPPPPGSPAFSVPSLHPGHWPWQESLTHIFFKSYLLILENFRPKEKWTEGYNESFHTLHWTHQLQALCHIYCRLSLSPHMHTHTHTYTFCP